MPNKPTLEEVYRNLTSAPEGMTPLPGEEDTPAPTKAARKVYLPQMKLGPVSTPTIYEDQLPQLKRFAAIPGNAAQWLVGHGIDAGTGLYEGLKAIATGEGTPFDEKGGVSRLEDLPGIFDATYPETGTSEYLKRIGESTGNDFEIKDPGNKQVVDAVGNTLFSGIPFQKSLEKIPKIGKAFGYAPTAENMAKGLGKFLFGQQYIKANRATDVFGAEGSRPVSEQILEGRGIKKATQFTKTPISDSQVYNTAMSHGEGLKNEASAIVEAADQTGAAGKEWRDYFRRAYDHVRKMESKSINPEKRKQAENLKQFLNEMYFNAISKSRRPTAGELFGEKVALYDSIPDWAYAPGTSNVKKEYAEGLKILANDFKTGVEEITSGALGKGAAKKLKDINLDLSGFLSGKKAIQSKYLYPRPNMLEKGMDIFGSLAGRGAYEAGRVSKPLGLISGGVKLMEEPKKEIKNVGPTNPPGMSEIPGQ